MSDAALLPDAQRAAPAAVADAVRGDLVDGQHDVLAAHARRGPPRARARRRSAAWPARSAAVERPASRTGARGSGSGSSNGAGRGIARRSRSRWRGAHRTRRSPDGCGARRRSPRRRAPPSRTGRASRAPRRRANARLSSASCRWHSTSSASLRPAQTGSPMPRTLLARRACARRRTGARPGSGARGSRRSRACRRTGRRRRRRASSDRSSAILASSSDHEHVLVPLEPLVDERQRARPGTAPPRRTGGRRAGTAVAAALPRQARAAAGGSALTAQGCSSCRAAPQAPIAPSPGWVCACRTWAYTRFRPRRFDRRGRAARIEGWSLRELERRSARARLKASCGASPPKPSRCPSRRQAVAEFCERCGVPAPLIDDVKLVVTEACTNVVLHAYDDGPARAMRTFELARTSSRERCS